MLERHPQCRQRSSPLPLVCGGTRSRSLVMVLATRLVGVEGEGNEDCEGHTGLGIKSNSLLPFYLQRMAAQRGQVTRTESHSTWVAEAGRYRAPGQWYPNLPQAVHQDQLGGHFQNHPRPESRDSDSAARGGSWEPRRLNALWVTSRTHGLHYRLLRGWGFCSVRIQGAWGLGQETRRLLSFHWPLTEI